MTWTEFQEAIGELIQERIEQILAEQGNADNYTLEDVQLAATQARKDLGISETAKTADGR